MADLRTAGSSIPFLQRIRGYRSFATLFHRYRSNAAVTQSLHQEAAEQGESIETTSVVQATLVPVGTALPTGRIVPVSRMSTPTRRSSEVPPAVHRQVAEPASRRDPLPIPSPPVGEPETIPTAQEPTLGTLRPATFIPAAKPESESTISNSDWSRLKRFMAGYEKKQAEVKQSSEYIQRQKEIAEQDAVRRQAEAETKARQDMARAGKLPKAQVVYLSPDEPAPTPIQKMPDASLPSKTAADKTEVEAATTSQDLAGATEEIPAIGDRLPSGVSPAVVQDERAPSESRDTLASPTAEGPVTARQPDIQSSKPITERPVQERPEPLPARSVSPAEPSIITPPSRTGDYRPPSEAPKEKPETPPTLETGFESPAYAPVETRLDEWASAEPVVADEPQTTSSVKGQLEKEPGRPPAITPAPVEQPDTREKEGVGQRLLRAARSLFRRQAEPVETEHAAAAAKPSGRDEPVSINTAPEPSAETEVLPHEPLHEEQLQDDMQDKEAQPSGMDSIQMLDAPLGARPVETAPPISPPVITPAKFEVAPAEMPPISQHLPDAMSEGSIKPARVEAREESRVIDVPPPSEGRHQPSLVEPPPQQPRLADEPASFSSLTEVGEQPEPVELESREKIKLTEPGTSISRDPQTKPLELAAETPAEKRPEATVDMVPAEIQQPPRRIEPADIPARQHETGHIVPADQAASVVEPAEPVDAAGDTDRPEEDRTGTSEANVERLAEPVGTETTSQPPTLDQFRLHEGQSPTQPKPLDESWPVKQVPERRQPESTGKPAPIESPSEQPIDEGDLPTLIVQSDLAEDESHEQVLRSILNEVTPGKATDSSVELVPPRRPRPQLPASPRPAEVIAPGAEPKTVISDEPEALSQPEFREGGEEHPPVQRQVVPSQSEETAADAPQERPRSDVPAHPSPTVEEEQQPGYIQTEIGPLPRDFWDYLGEPLPPGSKPSKPTSDEPVGPADSSRGYSELPRIPRDERQVPPHPQLPESRSLVEAPRRPALLPPPPAPAPSYRETAIDTGTEERIPTQTATPILDYATPSRPTGLESVLPWVQRQDEGQRSETGTPEEPQQTEEGSDSGPDIEALAKEILPLIKRKLAIEWERNRGRF